MHLLLGTIKKEIPGDDVTVDCLWCGKAGTTAHSRQRTEWLTIFHVLPLFPFHTVFVQCGSCQKDMIAKCSLREVSQSNPFTLKYLLVKRVSFVGKVCIVLGLLLCWSFYVGLIPSIIGFIYRQQYDKTLRKAAILGLILNIFSPLVFILLFSTIKLLTK